MSLTTIPTLCGSVAGKPSPLGVKLHDAGYAALNLNYKYVAMGTDDLSSVIDAIKSLGFRGCGVSMPFKQEVIRFLNQASDEVLAIGACNTVVNNGGVLHGYNTDWRGAIKSLEECGGLTGSTALIVGSGGAARAIAYGLKKHGYAVWIASRNTQTAGKMVDDLGLSGVLSLERQAAAKADVVVNATPVSDNSSPLRLDEHTTAKSLLDVAFSPRITSLAAEAAEKGLAVAPGWRMLLHQALFQFELYTGQPAPINEMSSILEQALP